MATLRDDQFMRGHGVRRRIPVSGLHCALIFVSLALLVLARLEHPLVRTMQNQLNGMAAQPLIYARGIIKPLSAVWERGSLVLNGNAEIKRLRARVAELRGVEREVVRSQVRLEALGRVARLVRRSDTNKIVTTNVLAGAGGVFRRSLLIDAGSNDGVHEGYPVYGTRGLIGRTIDVTDDTSRVLLLNDVNSWVPVHVGGKLHRAIMAGDGSDDPRLLFVSELVLMQPGDEIVTSGAAGMLPAGLSIGQIVSAKNGLRVRLHAGGGPYRYVRVHQSPGPGARLTGFIAGKAFERRLEAVIRKHRRRPVAADRAAKPVTGALNTSKAIMR